MFHALSAGTGAAAGDAPAGGRSPATAAGSVAARPAVARASKHADGNRRSVGRPVMWRLLSGGRDVRDRTFTPDAESKGFAHVASPGCPEPEAGRAALPEPGRLGRRGVPGLPDAVPVDTLRRTGRTSSSSASGSHARRSRPSRSVAVAAAT